MAETIECLCGSVDDPGYWHVDGCALSERAVDWAYALAHFCKPNRVGPVLAVVPRKCYLHDNCDTEERAWRVRRGLPVRGIDLLPHFDKDG